MKSRCEQLFWPNAFLFTTSGAALHLTYPFPPFSASQARRHNTLNYLLSNWIHNISQMKIRQTHHLACCTSHLHPKNRFILSLPSLLPKPPLLGLQIAQSHPTTRAPQPNH